MQSFLFQDPFKYSYPPLPDDDFQTPLCENGPILGEAELDDKEKGDGDCKEIVDANHSEESLQKPKRVRCYILLQFLLG